MYSSVNKLLSFRFEIKTFFIICFKSAFANEKSHQFKIEADKSIEYFEKEKTYVASGSAKASKGKFSMKAEKITIFMEKTKNSHMTDIEATGNVIILVFFKLFLHFTFAHLHGSSGTYAI